MSGQDAPFLQIGDPDRHQDLSTHGVRLSAHEVHNVLYRARQRYRGLQECQRIEACSFFETGRLRRRNMDKGMKIKLGLAVAGAIFVLTLLWVFRATILWALGTLSMLVAGAGLIALITSIVLSRKGDESKEVWKSRVPISGGLLGVGVLGYILVAIVSTVVLPSTAGDKNPPTTVDSTGDEQQISKGKPLRCTIGSPYEVKANDELWTRTQIVVDQTLNAVTATIDDNDLHIAISCSAEKWPFYKNAFVPARPYPLLIRYFDKDGQYLGHFTTKELYAPEWTLPYIHMYWKLDGVVLPLQQSRELTYTINARDAAFIEAIEVSFDVGGKDACRTSFVGYGKEGYLSYIFSPENRWRLLVAMRPEMLREVKVHNKNTTIDEKFFGSLKGSLWADLQSHCVTMESGHVFSEVDKIDIVFTDEKRGSLSLGFAQFSGSDSLQLAISFPGENGNAKICRLEKTKEFLSEHNVAYEAPQSPTQLILSALKDGREEAAHNLLKKHPALAKADIGGGWTLLHYACRYGQLSVVKELLEMGADVNKLTKEDYGRGNTLGGYINYQVLDRPLKSIPEDDRVAPLHMACIYGDIHIVSLLLENGSKVSGKYTFGAHSELVYAVKYGHHDVVERLLKHGSSLEFRGGGCLPFGFALQNDDVAMMKLLVQGIMKEKGSIWKNAKSEWLKRAKSQEMKDYIENIVTE